MSKKTNKEKAIEETLWQSCDKLRGSVEPAEYKHVVLGLIFLKFASDKFEQRRKELIAKGNEKYVEMKYFYAMKNVFYLEEISRWSYIIKNATQNDISLKIDTALNTIEKNNPALIEKYVQRWFILSILTGRYSGSPESVFDYDIKNVDSKDFGEYLRDVESARFLMPFGLLNCYNN